MSTSSHSSLLSDKKDSSCPWNSASWKWGRAWPFTLGGIALLFSMVTSTGFEGWRACDLLVYQGCQQLLATVSGLPAIYALLNAHPLGNWIMDVGFALFGLPWLLEKRTRHELARKLAFVSYYVCTWKITMTIINRWLYASVIGWESASPALEVTPLVNLQEVAPTLNVKVFAEGTFPSDHAMQLLLLALVLHAYSPKWSKWIVPFTILFSTPRLFSGAHWFSDIVAGGLGIACLAYAFWFASPLFSYGIRPFLWVWQRILRVPALPPKAGQQEYSS
jgi:membrane-associated phospholipid phosphatase